MKLNEHSYLKFLFDNWILKYDINKIDKYHGIYQIMNKIIKIILRHNSIQQYQYLFFEKNDKDSKFTINQYLQFDQLIFVKFENFNDDFHSYIQTKFNIKSIDINEATDDQKYRYLKYYKNQFKIKYDIIIKEIDKNINNIKSNISINEEDIENNKKIKEDDENVKNIYIEMQKYIENDIFFDFLKSLFLCENSDLIKDNEEINQFKSTIKYEQQLPFLFREWNELRKKIIIEVLINKNKMINYIKGEENETSIFDLKKTELFLSLINQEFNVKRVLNDKYRII
jgi:hypothetical protein